MKNLYIRIITIALIFSSCNIEREPYEYMAERKVYGSEETRNALLNGCYSQLTKWSDVMHRCGEYAGDNIVIRGSSTDAFYEFISYSRSPDNYRLQNFWDAGYKLIAQSSNFIRENEKDTTASVKSMVGECHFMRGMMYFYLCRAYGRPYYDNPEKNLGVPIVNGTPKEIDGITLPDRSNVKETYEQAISDLKKAIELINPEKKSPVYGSVYASKALLSRIYLYMSGTFEHPNTEYAELAKKYADEVINSEVYSLLDRDNFMKYNTFTPEENRETIFAIKRKKSEFSGWDHYYGFGGMYAFIGGMGWAEMYASEKYLQLLDETGRNDWYRNEVVDARAAFIEPQYKRDKNESGSVPDYFRYVHDLYKENGELAGYAYRQDTIIKEAGKLYAFRAVVKKTDGTIESPAEKYEMSLVDAERNSYTIEFKDGKTYTGYIDKLIKLNRAYPMFYIVKCSREGEDSHLHSPVISRLSEIYLNRAEAAAKLGDYATATADLNTVRTRSLPNAAYPTLSNSDAEELITKERQLELAFQAERSYDVFRNGRNLTRRYPGPHNALEDIASSDYRVVYYIPQSAINSYPGSLTQNPTN